MVPRAYQIKLAGYTPDTILLYGWLISRAVIGQFQVRK